MQQPHQSDNNDFLLNISSQVSFGPESRAKFLNPNTLQLQQAARGTALMKQKSGLSSLSNESSDLLLRKNRLEQMIMQSTREQNQQAMMQALEENIATASHFGPGFVFQNAQRASDFSLSMMFGTKNQHRGML